MIRYGGGTTGYQGWVKRTCELTSAWQKEGSEDRAQIYTIGAACGIAVAFPQIRSIGSCASVRGVQ